MKPYRPHVIVGVDPGGTTGFAVYVPQTRTFRSWQAGPDEITTNLDAIIAAYGGNEILFACERFLIGTNTAKRTRQNDALEIIGTIKNYCKAQKAVVFNLQNAAEAKHLGSRDHLRHIGWWNSRMRHANDAAKQILLAMLKTHPDEVDRMLASYKI